MYSSHIFDSCIAFEEVFPKNAKIFCMWPTFEEKKSLNANNLCIYRRIVLICDIPVCSFWTGISVGTNICNHINLTLIFDLLSKKINSDHYLLAIEHGTFQTAHLSFLYQHLPILCDLYLWPTFVKIKYIICEPLIFIQTGRATHNNSYDIEDLSWVVSWDQQFLFYF